MTKKPPTPTSPHHYPLHARRTLHRLAVSLGATLDQPNTDPRQPCPCTTQALQHLSRFSADFLKAAKGVSSPRDRDPRLTLLIDLLKHRGALIESNGTDLFPLFFRYQEETLLTAAQANTLRDLGITDRRRSSRATTRRRAAK